MGGVINIIIKKNKTAGGYVGTRLGGREQALYGGVLTGKVGKLNLDVNYNLTEVRKSDRDGDSNMYGPQRYVDFKGRCQFDETRGLSFGASYMKEQYGSFSEGDPTAMSASARDDMMEWYDNNRQSYFVKYDGYHSKNDYEFQNDYNRLGKESRKKTPGIWRDFDHSKYETYVVEAKNTYHVDEHHTVTYGGEYRKQKAGARAWHRCREADRRNLSRHDQAIWLGRCEKLCLLRTGRMEPDGYTVLCPVPSL